MGGLPKRPIAGGLITPLGIEGDRHAHPSVHGGPRKAILLIASEVVEELIETFIDYKRKNEADAIRLRPHPYEFALYYDI